jgi:glycosyltransferase involved in cell wall biosynthesis
MMGALTVVIPTYNRADVLKLALQAYGKQSAPELIRELIVVDDGSTDHTDAVVNESQANCPFPVRYLKQTNRGPAAARNVGIRESRSELILFTDSDIVPAPTLVSQHVKWHKRHPEQSTGILGYVTWAADVKPTPFMRWYGEEGPLFGFRNFRHGRDVRWFDFAACNVSLKADFLKEKGLFDEEFKRAAYEDTELGYRLGSSGLRLLYNARAVAYHHQFLRFADVLRKSERNGPSERLFFQKEAGRFALQQRERRQAQLSYRVARVAATWAGAALQPATRFVDSRLPMPSLVYRLFFWYNVARHENHTGGKLHKSEDQTIYADQVMRR